MNIYVVRHGETPWNTQLKLQGRSDIPLNERGIEQARLTGEGLKTAGICFDKVYSSPLQRAVKTAELISGFSPLKIIKEHRIIEFSFGKAEGSTPQQRQTNPDFAPIKNFFNDPPAYAPAEGAESFDEVFARTSSFWEEEIRSLSSSPRNKNILVVTHGGTLQTLLMHIDGRPLKDFWKVSFPNCSVNKVVLEDGKFSLEWTSRVFYTQNPSEQQVWTTTR